jgi:hypothetical protein
MKLKRFQLSLGSLFLATLTFGVGLFIGLRVNAYKSSERLAAQERERLKAKYEIEAAFTAARRKAYEKLLETQRQELSPKAQELQRLKDERGE